MQPHYKTYYNERSVKCLLSYIDISQIYVILPIVMAFSAPQNCLWLLNFLPPTIIATYPHKRYYTSQFVMLT